jgi:PIN domain nuclease of toxin-antitoxin system
MQVLLDTHAFLWWVQDAPQLPRRARAVITDPRNECFVSLVSCWEMAIKVSLGKLKMTAPIERFVPEQLARNDFGLLAIELEDVVTVASLAFHHRDPFDRLLVAQALGRRLPIISRDTIFRRYGLTRLW